MDHNQPDLPSDRVEPDDGMFFCEIRKHQGFYGEVNPGAENEWLQRLSTVSTTRRERFMQLLNHQSYLNAFTAFLQARLQSLFAGFQLLPLAEILASGTEQESIGYLTDTLLFWKRVFGGDVVMMGRMRRADIDELQGSAPGASSQERRALLEMIEAGRILTSYDNQERQHIWEAICANTTDRMVPSMFTFFEDWNFLGAAGTMLKHLIPPGVEISRFIHDAICNEGQAAEKCIIQLTKRTCTFVCCGGTARAEVGRRQLWLAALRQERQEMKSMNVKNDKSAVNHRVRLQELATLAKILGVVSEEIQRNVVKRKRSSPVRGPSQLRRQQREAMFLTDMHTPQQHSSSQITAGFAWRSLYFSFFGRQLPFNISVIPAFPRVYYLGDLVVDIALNGEGDWTTTSRVQSAPHRLIGLESPKLELEKSLHEVELDHATAYSELVDETHAEIEQQIAQWTTVADPLGRRRSYSIEEEGHPQQTEVSHAVAKAEQKSKALTQTQEQVSWRSELSDGVRGPEHQQQPRVSTMEMKQSETVQHQYHTINSSLVEIDSRKTTEPSEAVTRKIQVVSPVDDMGTHRMIRDRSTSPASASSADTTQWHTDESPLQGRKAPGTVRQSSDVLRRQRKEKPVPTLAKIDGTLAPTPGHVRVTFKRLKPQGWKTRQTLDVDPSKPMKFQWLVNEYHRRGYYLFDENRARIPLERATEKLVGSNRSIFILRKPESE